MQAHTLGEVGILGIRSKWPLNQVFVDVVVDHDDDDDDDDWQCSEYKSCANAVRR